MSAPLPPGVMELREELDGLRGENGLMLLGLEKGDTLEWDSVMFLAAGVTDELMVERGTAAVDDLWMPVPR